MYVLLDKEGIQEDVGLRKSRTINFDERKRHLEEMQVHLKKFIQENPECPEEVLRSKFEKANPDLWIARSMHPGDSFGEIALFDQGDGYNC